MALRADDVDLNRDRLLVEAWQAGDASAFDDLYSMYFDRLRSFCQRKVGDPSEAEELAQEAFAKALQALPRFAGERRFYPWVTVIASRLCVDHHRRRSRVQPVAEIDLDPIEDDVHERMAFNADVATLDRALGRLGPRHREVLAMREQEGLSYQQIADRLAVPQSTIETLLFRARRALRREFVAVAGGRLAAIPGVGWIGLRLGRMRDRVALAAPDLGAIGGTVAAAAVTAVLVVSPVSAPPPADVVDRPTTVTLTATPAAAAAATPVTPATAPARPTEEASSTPPPPPATPAPRVDPMGGTEARDNAADMGYQIDLGPAAGIAVDPSHVTERASLRRNP